ncbi:unnamed protein product [Closterium sp. NIES-53]
MYITLYFIVTRLPNSLGSVRDHFLYLDPTVLTIDLLEQHLLAAETSVVAVGAARGTPHTPFFEGGSPSPLALSYASAAAVDVPGAEDIGAALLVGGGGSCGSGGGSEGFDGSGGGTGGSGGSGSGGSGGSSTGAQRGGSGGGERQQQQQCRSETPSPQQLREWFAQRAAFGGGGSCLYVFRTGDYADFGDEAERPPRAELLRSGVAIFDLDYDAAMYALSVSAEDDCYLCVPPDPDKEAVALGASESVLPSTALVEAFTLDSVLARSSTMLPCPAVPSGSLPGLHLPSFSTNLVSASGQVAPPCSCRLLSHQTLLWIHRLGHPSLPCLRGMHSRLLVSGLPRSLPPLPPSPAPPCLPCVEGRQRAAPHSSSFPPTSAPLQTLHMDVWGPARVSGQGRERYFLLVVDDYTRYTTVFPLRSKGQVVDVLIPWIRAVRLQLRERFRADIPVLRLHSDKGGEFSSVLLWDFCRGEGILQTFTLPDSPQQNGISEHHIGLVMEYAAHQLNLWPHVSLPKTSPTLRWTAKVGDASVFRVWGSRAFVRDTSADKLSARAIPCVFLGFSPNALGWQFYRPTSRRVFPSQDVTFDESVPFYCLFPYRSAPPPPPPLFLAPGPPPVDALPHQGLAPSARDTGAGGAGVTAGAGGTRGAAAAGPGGARTRGTGAAVTGGVGGTGAGDHTEPGAAGAGGAGAIGAEAGGTCAGGAGARGA